MNKAAGEIGSAFANAAVVHFKVSWGSVQGAAIPTGDIASSVESLSGPYTYATLKADLRAAAAANPRDSVLQSAVAHLPSANPAGSLSYKLPYAEAQAMGLLPPRMTLAAGGIGFSSAVNWDYNESDGITAGTYDLVGAATHEIFEVLGRVSGLESSRPTTATPFDLFRYSTVGVSSFSYSASAYLSIDGGRTSLQRFNIAGTGDRSDVVYGGGAMDVQTAYLSTGRVLNISSADLMALDALGWGAYTAPRYGGIPDPQFIGTMQSFGGGVPEPATWTLMFAGIGGLGAMARSRPANKPGACLG